MTDAIGTPKGASGWRSAVLFVLLPAVVAGIFSIAPKVYEEIRKPNSKLTYQLSTGPELIAGSNRRRIVSLTVVNAGKTRLQDIYANVSLPDSRIEGAAADHSRGLSVTYASSVNSRAVMIKNMLPGDMAKLAVMVASQNAPRDPIITLRSDDTVGVPVEQDAEPTGKDRTAVGAAATMAAAASTMLLLFLFIGRNRGVRYLFSRGIDEEQSHRDIVLLVSKLAGPGGGLAYYAERERFSYASLSDHLYLLSMRGSDEEKTIGVNGLKILLGLPTIHPMSQAIIEQYVRLAQPDMTDDEIAEIVRGADAVNHGTGLFAEVRRIIYSFYGWDKSCLDAALPRTVLNGVKERPII